MLLDVRTDDEWAGGRIAGSVHIPMDQLMQRMDELDDRVVCVCAVGARSARVAQFLNAQGREAVNLDGGLYAWAEQRAPGRGLTRLPGRILPQTRGIVRPNVFDPPRGGWAFAPGVSVRN